MRKPLTSRAEKFRLWLSRLCIGAVLFLNVQCAVLFIADPARFAPGFELQGESGSAMIQGMGLLFLMWNVPYLVALIDPLNHRLSLFEAVIMQAVGAGGETLLLYHLQGAHPLLRASVLRFIIYDTAGLATLLIAGWIVYTIVHSHQ